MQTARQKVGVADHAKYMPKITSKAGCPPLQFIAKWILWIDLSSFGRQTWALL